MKKTWLELATNDLQRMEYRAPHGNMGTDGFRMHYDQTQPAPEDDGFYARAVETVMTPARKVTATVFSITKAALVTACKQAIAIGKDPRRSSFDYVPPLSISVNGSLKYYANSEGNGSVSGEWSNMTFETSRKTDYPVTSSYKLGKGMSTFYTCKVEYTHEGRDVEFGINPSFLLDALSGMDSETITFRVQARNGSIYLTDGTREAVIMAICL